MKESTQGKLLDVLKPPPWLNKEPYQGDFPLHHDVTEIAEWLKQSDESMVAAAGVRILALFATEEEPNDARNSVR